MSDGYRNGAFALGLVVGGGLVLNLLLWADYQAYRQSDEPSQAHDYSDGGEIGRTWDWIIGTFVSPSDTLAQWIMATFTIVAVVLVYRTLVATREMVRDTKDIGKAQVRAYAAFHPSAVTFERSGFPHSLGVIVTGALRNVGQSPATNVVLWHSFRVEGRHVERVQVDTQEMNGPYRQNDVLGGAELRVSIQDSFPLDLDGLTNDRLRLRLVAIIKFEDVFGDRWSARMDGDLIGNWALVASRDANLDFQFVWNRTEMREEGQD